MNSKHRSNKPYRRRSAAPAKATLFLALAAVAALTSCSRGNSASETATVKKDQQLVIAIDAEPDTLDPQSQTTSVVASILKYSVETLTNTTATGELAPGLATSWKLSNDGLKLTLDLRKNVTFQNGSPFTSTAVKATLDRVLDPKVTVPYRSAFSAISEVLTPDAHTVELVLSRPAPALPKALSLETVGILAPDSVSQNGNSYTKIVLPVGTGPYRVEQYDRGEKIAMSRNESYWGAKPYFKGISFKIVPEASSRQNMLMSGEAQMILSPPLTSLDAISKNSSTTVHTGLPARTLYAVFNTQRPPFDNPLVRRALNYAIDREAIIKSVMHNTAEAAKGPLAPALADNCTMDHPYAYDPEKARTLLKDAGVKSLEVEFGAPNGKYPQATQIAQAIAGYLKDVGVTVKVTTLDWPTYVGRVTSAPKDNFGLHILGWAASYMDPQQPMTQFQSDQAPPRGLATSFYKNAKVDALLASAAKEINLQTRSALYCDAQKIVWDDAPFIFLWAQKYPIAFNSALTGITVAPNEYFDTIHARPAN
ncbi:ABC transporter substrate-binding protein [Ramlibacter tataouinensis]|uniref:ABC transporter substrate-binding protein n=1 Tax=Ramlibacter tataouinensis TaxID=94132 RepID=UPI0022F3B9D6|nr:ABC transporter substrate-binding protein [Ramlibacter tataouinensis]WBY02771.1 ABC transporter substrate-binding protein [Ramlibacter tataouinensis]